MNGVPCRQPFECYAVDEMHTQQVARARVESLGGDGEGFPKMGPVRALEIGELGVTLGVGQCAQIVAGCHGVTLAASDLVERQACRSDFDQPSQAATPRVADELAGAVLDHEQAVEQLRKHVVDGTVVEPVRREDGPQWQDVGSAEVLDCRRASVSACRRDAVLDDPSSIGARSDSSRVRGAPEQGGELESRTAEQVLQGWIDAVAQPPVEVNRRPFAPAALGTKCFRQRAHRSKATSSQPRVL